jgi:hypothetical protein
MEKKAASPEQNASRLELWSYCAVHSAHAHLQAGRLAWAHVRSPRPTGDFMLPDEVFGLSAVISTGSALV